jgi:hypothetical protein
MSKMTPNGDLLSNDAEVEALAKVLDEANLDHAAGGWGGFEQSCAYGYQEQQYNFGYQEQQVALGMDCRCGCVGQGTGSGGGPACGVDQNCMLVG